jgi:hypothetical protein
MENQEAFDSSYLDVLAGPNPDIPDDTRSEQNLPMTDKPCMPTDLILIEPFNHTEPYPEHPSAHGEYGFTCKVDDNVAGAMVSFVGKLAGTILTGKFDL